MSASPPEVASRPRLLFLVTEDWYFCSHRLPVARAARDAGFAVAVATRVRAHGAQIRAEGFTLLPLRWRRGGDGIFGHLRAIAEIRRLYRRERPDILHHVALKAVLFGALAARLAFPRRAAPAIVSAVMGLGSGFGDAAGRWRKAALGWAVKHAAGGGTLIVQNPEDRDVLVRYGLEPKRIVLIRGSGVDTVRFAVLPPPAEHGIAIGLVGRMLRSKGVLEAAAAVRRLRAEGGAVELLLAGMVDAGNSDTLSEVALADLSREPGISWLGHVADVREVWRRVAIAVLPSTYGEGLPAALLEAASCGRPIIATDVPGCREAVLPGETGLLVPPHDPAALANAIAALAGDPERRAAMGRAGRALVEREFSEAIVVRKTLALYRELYDARAHK